MTLNMYAIERGDAVTRDRDGVAGTIVMVFEPGGGGRNMYGSPTALVRWADSFETIGPHVGMLNPDCVSLA